MSGESEATILRPTSYTRLHPTPYTLHLAPSYTLHPSPYTPHPTPDTIHPPTPCTLHPPERKARAGGIGDVGGERGHHPRPLRRGQGAGQTTCLSTNDSLTPDSGVLKTALSGNLNFYICRPSFLFRFSDRQDPDPQPLHPDHSFEYEGFFGPRFWDAM